MEELENIRLSKLTEMNEKLNRVLNKENKNANNHYAWFKSKS
jgi:hypothetical protein